MNKPNPKLLVLVHLDKNGISRESLLEAASFFPDDSFATEVKEVESRKRGRPTKHSLQWVGFYIYAKYWIDNEKKPTIKKIVDELEECRKIAKKRYEDNGEVVPNEFRSLVNSSTLKNWTRKKYNKFRQRDLEGFKALFQVLDNERQKIIR
jgi:hypothetical protein